MAELHRLFLATPYRPTGLSTSARAVVRLVDELSWLNTIMMQARPVRGAVPNQAACLVKRSSAAVLEHGADLLVSPLSDEAPLQAALAELRDALTSLERDATGDLPVRPREPRPPGPGPAGSHRRRGRRDHPRRARGQSAPSTRASARWS